MAAHHTESLRPEGEAEASEAYAGSASEPPTKTSDPTPATEARHRRCRRAALLDRPALDEAFGMCQSAPAGCHLLRDRPSLSTCLADRDRLSALPRGTLGRAYYVFTEREGRTAPLTTLSTAEERDGGEEAGERSYMRDHLYHAHDLLHVLTGYGRDTIGELCLLAFVRPIGRPATSGAPFPASAEPPRARWLAWLGGLGAFKRFGGLPLFRCLNEARKLGLQAEALSTLPWEKLVEHPLEMIRRRYGVGSPTLYLSIKDLVEKIDGNTCPMPTPVLSAA